MNSSNKVYTSIEEYISNFPKDIQKMLQQIRAAIKKAAPKSVEVISYGMPAFKMNKALVYFAVGKNHIGFYPTPNPIKVFSKELECYKTSKGAIQFPLDKKISLTLISKITKFRAQEDLELFKSRQKQCDPITDEFNSQYVSHLFYKIKNLG
jgi:uncharacterized protein YdhG (YjbR/CyaY superfamily)